MPTMPANAPGDALDRYLALLERWNRTHALTSLGIHERFEELIQDSQVLLPFLAGLAPGAKVLDLGTGMGIPAVVLALSRPDLQVVGMDASHKKIAFVRQAAMELPIPNLAPLCARAEQAPPQAAAAGVAKAVGTLDLLCGWWDRHGAPGAPLLALKGPEEALVAPAGWTLAVHPYRLPTRGERRVLELRRA